MHSMTAQPLPSANYTFRLKKARITQQWPARRPNPSNMWRIHLTALGQGAPPVRSGFLCDTERPVPKVGIKPSCSGFRRLASL